jgi:uncharacterized membrane protein
MTQKILSQFQIAGLVVDQTGSRMPETMKARRSLRAWNIQTIENRVEHVLSKNVLIEGIPIRFAENEIIRVIVLSPLTGILPDPAAKRCRDSRTFQTQLYTASSLWLLHRNSLFQFFEPVHHYIDFPWSFDWLTRGRGFLQH